MEAVVVTHPDPLKPLLTRSETFIELGSTTFRILECLLSHPGGLTFTEIVAILQIPKGTFSMATNQLLKHKEALKKMGIEFSINKTNPRVFIYHVCLCEPASTTSKYITDAMRKKTGTDVMSSLHNDRGIHNRLRPAKQIPNNVRDLIANATWAFPEELGTYACVVDIMDAARYESYLSVQELRERHACLKRDYAFLHKCEQTSFRYAPELGFVVRCLTESPERGQVGGFFLDPADRELICKRDYEESFHFDRLKPFSLAKVKQRARDLKSSHLNGFDELDEQMLLAIAAAQDKKEYFTSHQWADRLGVPRSTVFRRIQKSIEHRVSWRSYLRTRAPGVGGIEVCHYEGSQSPAED